MSQTLNNLMENLFTIYLALKRESSQSVLEYSLSLKKLSNVYMTFWPPIYLVPKKVSFIAFIIALTHDVKILWFGHQKAIFVNNWHKNAIFGCSQYQKFNFSCLLFKILFYFPKTEIILKLVYPLWTPPSTNRIF